MITNEKKTFSICIFVEVDAETLTEAYGKVYESMQSIDPAVSWESSDTNWFDNNGDSYTGEEISKARYTYMGTCREIIDRNGQIQVTAK